MRLSRTSFATLVCLASIAFCNDASAQPQPRPQQQYSAPVVILFDPEILPLSELLVDATLKTPQLMNKASKEVARADGEATAIYPLIFPPQFVADAGGGGPGGRLAGVLTIEFQVEPPDNHIEPRRVWQAVVEELEIVLSETAQRLEQRQESRWALQRELLEPDRLENQLEEARRAAAPVQIADPGDNLKQLFSRRQELTLQLAGIEARRQALQDRIDELQNGGATAGIDWEIIEQLEQVVAFHEQKLKMLQRASKAAQVAQSEVMAAEAELAKARIDRLRAKKEAAATSSPELAALSEELTEATITAAEQRAILQAVESRIEELKQAAAEQARQMQAAQEAEYRAEILRDQLATIEKRLSDMELERLEHQARRGGTVTIVPWSVPAEDD